MTSRDPAIEAAQRVWEQPGPHLDSLGQPTADTVIAAAREALRPIRELVEVSRAYGDYVRISEIEPLIYSVEELSAWTGRNNELKGTGA